MQNLSFVQWACIAGVAALIVLPRLGSLKKLPGLLLGKIGGLFGTSEAKPDANSFAQAYQLLEPALNPETAAAVRQQLADVLLRGLTALPPSPTKTEAKP